MAVTVSPEQFSMVFFDAAAIASVADDLLARLDLADHELAVVVDESSPLARISGTVGDDGTITVEADSGAFEDPRQPRRLSEASVGGSLGRTLLRLRDRLDGSCADAPADNEVTLPHLASWEVYAVGRLGRLGLEVHRQRWLYNFRNRHGFTDVADSAFEHLWSTDALTWSELTSISDAAAVAAASRSS
jgi:hypothetical protein